ncbi:glycosyltransferase family 4 protein [Algoriphagus sp. Y33]|uniref:glycosyltransferase family 4 protein n=1 Tax=Algoriphagus sp. Y33 TaxID=2772483 RepID=UPI00177B55A6|nr:glycosyltransferase family 4 protein [Algoriphagus sp. Y33]
MKLLFTQDALNNGGAERSHLEILSRFSAEVDSSFVYFYPRHDLKAAYNKAGIRLIFLDIPESYHFWLAVSRLVKLIRSEKPDLLISCLWRADIITRIASVITGVPLIGTLVNDSYAPLAWTGKKGLKYKVVYWLDRLTSGIPMHWIANARALADSHSKTLGLDPKKISVVYRGREVPFIASEARARQSQNPEESLSSPRFVSSQTKTTNKQELEPFHFLSYGRLLERKGFQDAIQAFSQVIQTYPNCTLTIYGEGPYRAELESLISKLALEDKAKLPGEFSNSTSLRAEGRGEAISSGETGIEKKESESPLPGNFTSDSTIGHSYKDLSKSNRIAASSLGTPRNNATNLLLEHDCFLFPSLYEGFSGALLEAMMAGVPIIASDIPMNLEAVIHQETALIYPVSKPKALAEQMCFAMNNSEIMVKLGEKARKVAIEKFAVDKIAREYEARIYTIYNSVIQHRTTKR